MKWICKRFVVALAAYVVTFTVANYAVAGRLEKEMALCKKIGIPLTPADVQLPTCEPENDAGPYFRAGAALTKAIPRTTFEFIESIAYRDGLLMITGEKGGADTRRKLTDEERDRLNGILPQGERMVELFLLGAGKSGYRSDVDLGEGAGMQLPNAAPAMNATRIACLMADAAVANGDAGAIVRAYRAMLALADWQRKDPVLINAMVAVTIDDYLRKSLERIFFEAPFTEKHVSELEAQLMQRPGAIHTRLYSFNSEPIFAWDFFKSYLKGAEDGDWMFNGAPSIVFGGFVRLWFLDNYSMCLKVYRRHFEGIERQRGQKKFTVVDNGAEFEEVFRRNSIRSTWASMLIPAFGMFDGRLLVGESRARLMVTALRLRRFQIRNGRLPEKLDELPEQDDFLLDPFSGTFHVYRQKEKGFVLYSVGPNGRDNGGLDPEVYQELEMKNTVDEKDCDDVKFEVPG